MASECLICACVEGDGAAYRDIRFFHAHLLVSPLFLLLYPPPVPSECSGRELFASDASLFVDDDAAVDAYERDDTAEGEGAGMSEAPKASEGHLAGIEEVRLLLLISVRGI